MMKRHGWHLLFHQCLIAQLLKLKAAVERAQAQDPEGFASNANVKLLNALARLIFEIIPTNPDSERYRLGNTMGPEFRHWRRAKIGRFRLFFRFDSQTRIIIYTWVNVTNTMRAAGSKTDPYTVFLKMLKSGNPPDDWSSLLAASKTQWDKTL